ncbi:hypothetical protein Tsubulata_046386 [Turnera subulata]|uniref:Tower domain-containing protein n=1 Tax=Turnera subulata TaxID=218843 RepID=A0A9Q0EXU9_9ROSI|nr:hypothetical protein Tsubulata_046386 [Turnera subulata]
MSTWQIFTDAGNNLRWEMSGRVIRPEAADKPTEAPIPHRLPSMADLLLEGKQWTTSVGCSKLIEKRNGGDADTAPMFRPGLGKSVALKQSSLARARAILGDGDCVASGETDARDNACGSSNSFFRTASGKSVDISSTGLSRAKALLGFEEESDHSGFQGFHHSVKPSNDNEQVRRQNASQHLGMKGSAKNSGSFVNVALVPKQSLISKASAVGSKLRNDANAKAMQLDMSHPAPKPPAIKFQTAGGRSLSVSSEALARARSLLGDPDIETLLNDGDIINQPPSAFRDSTFDEDLSNIKKDHPPAFTHPGGARSKTISKTFISPLKSSSKPVQPCLNSLTVISRSNLIEEFNAADENMVYRFHDDTPTHKPPRRSCTLNTVSDNSSENGARLSINPHARSLRAPLLDISNINGMTYANHKQTTGEKRRFGRVSSVSPFKRPRSSKFTTPLNKNFSFAPSGLSASSERSGGRRPISTRYPVQAPRTYIKEYFGVPFSDKSKLVQLTEEERRINSNTAEKYAFCNEFGQNCIGAEDFHHLLVQSGALVQYASKEWVTNHYKWIVWKLACYDRCYTAKPASKFLTNVNVIEELKYRYDREVNHGHRSAIKRILEGDASPSSMMVLCISAIYPSCKPNVEIHSAASNGAESNNAAGVELTDGWYAVDAILDVPLLKLLTAGKLSVGQKLRIWGAGLCGWVGPVSPLEVSKTVTLSLHINGTYRAHWADRLGFCKGIGAPMAFRCIKSNGGPIPRTLVGVTRIYPVLYKEKLCDGVSIVRSERMEANMVQMYNQRRSVVVEGVVSEFQRGVKGLYNDSDSEEGAKILKILETAAEPEVLMAEMSPDQLTSFASYQAKLEAKRQLDLEKAIKKALSDAGLGDRDVSTFMRVRVVGLSNHEGKNPPKEGIITIWSPTEKQQSDLVEGQAYAISGLLPVDSDSNMLHLQARGSSTKWQTLSPQEIQHFRKWRNLSLLFFLYSEFDIAAFVLYVGEVYTAAQQKKQWVFVTDCSTSFLQSEETSKSLLAISFCFPCVGDDSSLPVNSNLVGSTVGFRNLIKRAKDPVNHLWIAEATENSAYSCSFDSSNCSHLKNAATSIQSWAKISSSIIDGLKEKILFVIGHSNG